MESISYLNGLEETPLPAITTGTANEYIRVNSNESAYELAQPSDILPSQTGVSSGSLLSTNGTTTSWTATPSITSLQLSAGSATNPTLTFDDPSVPQNCGFYGGGNDVVHFSAAGSNQVSFVNTGIQLANGKTIRSLSSANSYFDFQSNVNPRINNSQTVSGTTTVSSATFGTSNLTLLNTTSATGATGAAQIQMAATGSITLGVSNNSTTPTTQVTIDTNNGTSVGTLNVSGGLRASVGFGSGTNGYHFANQPNDGMYWKNNAPVSLNLRRAAGSMIECTGSATEAYETVFRTNPAAASAAGATERMRIGNTQISASLPINITHVGGATEPSLMFGDSTAGSRSGMYSNPTDNTLNFCTNEVERMSIDNTGVKVVTVRAESGSQVDDKGYVFEDSHGSGLQWETTGSILRLCHTNSTMIGMTSNTVSINATTINANGNLTSSNKINVPNGSTGGIGLLNRTTQVDFNTTGDTVNLRSFGTIRVQASNSGVSLTGNTTIGSGTFTVSGGLADFGQAARVTGNLTVQSGNLILGTNNIASANTVNSNIFKTSAQGSNTLCAVRVNEDNCGLYQSNTGNLDIAAGGVNGLSINSSRVQTENIFNFNRCPAYQSNTQSGSGSFGITTTSNPCLFIFIPISGNSDLDFSASSNYFAGQQFQIITRDVSGRTGTIRYRAQSETIHITGGAAATTITSNTYHTLTLDRYHIVICNVDTNRFYLIQT